MTTKLPVPTIETLTLKVNKGQHRIDALASSVKELTETINGNKSDMLEQAFATGNDLIQLKALVKAKHGPIWTAWAKEHVTITHVQYGRYMKLAKNEKLFLEEQFYSINAAIAHINKQLKLEKPAGSTPVDPEPEQEPEMTDDDALAILTKTSDVKPDPKAEATPAKPKRGKAKVVPIKENPLTIDEIKEIEEVLIGIQDAKVTLEIFEAVFADMDARLLVKVGKALTNAFEAQPGTRTIKL